jgi:hypothetical protein
MRLITIILLIAPVFTYANSLESLITGKWTCDPYEFYLQEMDIIFDVTHKIEYGTNGIATYIHTFQMKGNADFFWFKTSSMGPWNVKGNKLTAEIDSTKIIDGSIPAPLISEDLAKAIGSLEKSYISEILESTTPMLRTNSWSNKHRIGGIYYTYRCSKV